MASTAAPMELGGSLDRKIPAHDDRILPSASRDYDDKSSGARTSEEGVEVVLGLNEVGGPLEHDFQDQNVFRPPKPVRPRAVRVHGSGGGSGIPPPPPPPPSHLTSPGSFGYGSRHPADYAHRSPYPVPYNPSGSFDDGYRAQQTHYSPHVQYPNPADNLDGINVISPNHKAASSSPQHGSYHYPPTSPVSRADAPPPVHSSPPRLRRYGIQSREGPYSAAQRGGVRHDDDSPRRPHHRHAGPPPPPTSSRGGPRVVAQSFDSDHYSAHHSHASHPTTPDVPHYGPPRHDYNPQPYPVGSFGTGSFDSHGPPPPPPAHATPSPHDDYYRYSGYSPQRHPESPYSQHSQHPGYSPGAYHHDAYHSPYPDYNQSGMRRGMYSYDDDGRRGYDRKVGSSSNSNRGMVLPDAAQEIDFDVTDPPMEPVTPGSTVPICDSPSEVNSYDVLLGRGGGTNSQIGNRRFRKLVQDFQPTYLLARRKEKPLLARTIVLIIRKRGGRFLKKNDSSGHLFEVGDAKAEAKTSQALREGLDVRATKSTSSVADKKKKKTKKGDDDHSESSEKDPEKDSPDAESAPVSPDERKTETRKAPSSPPILPKLNPDEAPESSSRSAVPRAGSPDHSQFRKRRRMRSSEGGRSSFMGNIQDKLFSDFCPPRADLARAPSPDGDDSSVIEQSIDNSDDRSRMNCDDDDTKYQANACNSAGGCAGIALDMVTGAASGSFFLGPRKWR